MKRITHNNKQQILKLYYNGVPPCTLIREYRVPSSTLYFWIKQNPKSFVINTRNDSEMMTYHKLVSHCQKIEKELKLVQSEIVNKVPRQERVLIIDKKYGTESLHVLCEAFMINRSTYLNHQKRSKKNDVWFKKREAKYNEMVKAIYEESGHIYGARKIAAVMRRKGERVSDKYVRKLMGELGLHSERSSADKNRALAARHLRKASHSAQQFHPDGADQVWVSDTTAIRINQRYYYVCVYIDLFSRKVVGWGLGQNNSTRLVNRTFLGAYAVRQPKSLTVHTDNGSCYTSYGFERTLQKSHTAHSYSFPHHPHSNAVAESFFNTLKREKIFLQGLPRSRRELQKYVAEYVEYYNCVRLHENLNYHTPAEIENDPDLIKSVPKS